MARRSSWKNERASVTRAKSSHSKSNKFSEHDQTKRPEPGSRKKVWVGGYDRQDGTHVEGYFRAMSAAT